MLRARQLLVMAIVLAAGCAQDVEVGDDTGRTESLRDDRLQELAKEIEGVWIACSTAPQALAILIFEYEGGRGGTASLAESTEGRGLVGRYDFYDLDSEGNGAFTAGGGAAVRFPFSGALQYSPSEQEVRASSIIFRRDCAP